MKKLLIGFLAAMLLVGCQFEIGVTAPDDYEPVKVIDVTPPTDPVEPTDPVVIIPPPVDPIDPPPVDPIDPPPVDPVGDIGTVPTLDTSGAIWMVNFESHSEGTDYTAALADADFNFKWQSFSMKESTITNGRWAMLIPKDQIKKGVHAAKDVTEIDAVYFGYEIEFDIGYDFTSLGGKLPGLLGLNKNLKTSSGGQAYPDGCSALGQRSDEGFSLRSMFREGGRAIGYFYHQDNPEMLPGGNNNCGHEIDYMHEGQPFSFQKGVRYYVETYAQMNDANERNGIVRIWVNGQLVLEKTDMMLGENRLYSINHLFFYFWHGGGSSSWEPNVDSLVSFDNIIMSTTPISH